MMRAALQMAICMAVLTALSPMAHAFYNFGFFDPNKIENLQWITWPLSAMDVNGDGDVDMTDFGLFQLCLNGTGPILPNCGGCDFNNSNEVDQYDLNIFLQCLSGEDVLADHNCEE